MNCRCTAEQGVTDTQQQLHGGTRALLRPTPAAPLQDKDNGELVTFCTGVRASDTLMPMWCGTDYENEKSRSCSSYFNMLYEASLASAGVLEAGTTCGRVAAGWLPRHAVGWLPHPAASSLLSPSRRRSAVRQGGHR